MKQKLSYIEMLYLQIERRIQFSSHPEIRVQLCTLERLYLKELWQQLRDL
jgi:hypothetical protein